MSVFDAHHAGPLAIGDQLFDDLVQKMILHKSDSDLFERVVKPMIRQNLYEAEGLAAGASEVFLRLCSMHFDPKARQRVSAIDLKTLHTDIAHMSKIRATRHEIMSFIERRCSNDVADLLKEALKLASRDDVIEVSRSHRIGSHVERVEGYNFTEVKVDPSYTGSKVWKESDVRMILIDGVLEKSQHVEGTLMHSNKEGIPYVIICREATDEVKNACIVNFMRKTADVVLCTAPYSEKTAHIFNDLKELTGCDVISPEMGDLVTTQIFKKSHRVKKVSINVSNIELVTDHEFDIKSYRDRIRESMHQIGDPTVTDLIQQRLKTLTGRKVLVKIGDDAILRRRNAVEQVDKTLREMKDIITTGLVCDLSVFPFLDQHDMHRSLKSVKVGFDSYNSFTTVLRETGIILLQD